MKENFKYLHEKAVEISGRFHRAEWELIDILQRIDDDKGFFREGYTSLYDYGTRALKLSEASCLNFIAVPRKSKTVPDLKLAIQNGDITVSKARKITPVLNLENNAHWLEQAKILPKPRLEKDVARVMPQAATIERAKYVTESRLEVKLGVSEETMKKLKRVQDLVSQKTKGAATLENTLEALLENYLEKHDPVTRAKRAVIVDAHAPVSGTRYIPAQQKHQVQLRDGGRCAHTDEAGERCMSERWLEIHHKVPLARGGTNDVQNPQTLCHAHHKRQHL